MQKLRELCVTPHKQKASLAKVESGKDKNETDGAVLEDFAPATDRSYAVLLVVVALYWTVQAALDSGTCTAAQRAVANSCIVLIVFSMGLRGGPQNGSQ